ncbi:DUF4467 domain-containing protein [Staphylococcus lugdunensis]|uniref:cystatin-like fold lipoprotein n=1 Tax=Staphylococcus lugdunensis TaxID=28035 RepID=UPI00045B52F1|nr:cystatin-like fold lipoprotein [Staphylococcus lugdunensis]KAK57125.1 cystatin-like fold lipoprotein [Staphylococcus lugdunensis VCU150]MCI2844444.1 DUF4467 domain-containing protein [Staphylococcus lugdunensis]MDU4769686.1 cystatin-like fold lipoprotein [Staphylococcus lugdunensis]
MKKVMTALLIFAIVLAGCGKGDKYDKDINKVYKEQEDTNDILNSMDIKKADKKVDRDDSNTYVYEDGKVIIIGIKLTKKADRINYFTYKIKKGKPVLDVDENPIKYKKNHKADYEEENLKVKEEK